jgi:hypothetical protein
MASNKILLGLAAACVAVSCQTSSGHMSVDAARCDLEVGRGASVEVSAQDARIELSTSPNGTIAALEARGSLVIGHHLRPTLAEGGWRGRLVDCVLVEMSLTELLRRGTSLQNCLCISCSIEKRSDLEGIFGLRGYVILANEEKCRERSGSGVVVYGRGTMDALLEKVREGNNATFLAECEWEDLLVAGFPRHGTPALADLDRNTTGMNLSLRPFRS